MRCSSLVTTITTSITVHCYCDCSCFVSMLMMVVSEGIAIEETWVFPNPAPADILCSTLMGMPGQAAHFLFFFFRFFLAS